MNSLKNILIGIFCVLSLGKMQAQSIVFNNVYNDYTYTKMSPFGNTLYNSDYLNTIFEFDPNVYSLYGNASTNDYFWWEDSIYSYSYNIDLDEFGDTISVARMNLEPNSREASFAGIKSNGFEYVVGISNDAFEIGYEEANSTFIKLNAYKDTIYRKEFDFGEDTEFVTIKTKDNGATFQVLGFADTSSFAIDYNAFISTIDSNGNLISNIELGGTSNDFLYGLEYLDNGNYFVVGHTYSQGVGGADLWLLEVDTSGNIIWEKTYGTIYYDRIWNSKAILRKENYIYLAGQSSDNFTQGGTTTPTDVGWFMKLDLQGNIIWDKKYARGSNVERFVGLSFWDNESFIIGGGTSSYNNANDYPVGWLLKVDTSGNIIWEREIAKYKDQTHLVHHYPADMLVTKDRGILLGGYIINDDLVDINGYFHRNDAWLTKTDSCGYTVGDIPEPMLLIDSIVGKTVYITDQSTNYCTANLDWGDGTELESYYAYENNLPLTEKHLSHTYSQTGDYSIKTTTLAGEEFRDYEVQVLSLSNEEIPLAPFEKGGMFSIYPNPADEYIIVQILNQVQSDDILMTIHKLNGEAVPPLGARGLLNPKLYQQKIDVSSLNNGVYFVRFEVDGVLIATEKLVITR